MSSDWVGKAAWRDPAAPGFGFYPKDIPGLEAWYDVSAVVNSGNYLKNSEEFNTTWGRVRLNAFGATDTGAAGAGSFANTSRTADPLGNNAADFIQEDTTASASHDIGQTGITLEAGQYVFTCYVKPAGRDWFALYLFSTQGFYTFFNATTGVSGSSAGFAGGTFVSSSITSAGNGWYKCSITGIVSAGSYAARVYLAEADGDSLFDGDNTSGLFLWGASLRLSTWEDRYIPTSTNPIFPNAQADGANAVVGLRDLSTIGPMLDARGNYLLQSENFDTSWTLSNLNAFGAGSVANTGATTDPIGGNNADFIQENGAAAEHAISQQITAASKVLPLFPITLKFSCYVKQAGRTWVRLPFGTAADLGQAWFDVQNVVVGTVSNVGAATGAAATIKNVGNGWCLCEVTSTFPTSGNFTSYVYLATADTVTSYAGDGTSGLYVWGAQLRKSSWPSDYVRTTSAQVLPFRSESFRNLYQGTGANQPTLVPFSLDDKATLLFDGAAHYLKTLQFSLPQPNTVYLVVNQVSWTANDDLLSGFNSGALILFQSSSSPRVYTYSGSVGPFTSGLAVGVWGILHTIFNGTSSMIQVGIESPSTGNAGIGNPDGITLASANNGTVPSNIQVAELVVYSGAHDAATRLKIQQYLARKWTLPL